MKGDILKDLDLEAVFRALEDFTSTAYGKDLLGELKPALTQEECEKLLSFTQDMISFIKRRKNFHLSDVPDIREDLLKLKSGVLIEPISFHRIAVFIERTAHIRNQLLKADSEELLREMARGVHPPIELVWNIQEKITDEGKVKEGATPKLRGLISEKISVRGELVSRMENLVEKYRTVLQDDFWTLRNGRAVLPVRVEEAGSVPGILQGTSHTERTVFIEPEEVVVLNNRLVKLESEISSEIEGILRELSEEVLSVSENITECMEFIAELDLLIAKARLSLMWDGKKPEIQDVIELVQLRSPQLTSMGMDPVPSTVRLPADKRCIYIAGPNAGGKTVLLKAIGAGAVLPKLGIFLPCERNPKMKFYRNVYTLIGDFQDISQGLSSFSGRMKRLSEIFRNLNERTLLLLDEPFSGTGLREALALERALLEELNTLGVDVVITSASVEALAQASQYSWCLWGSMGYSVEKSSPTYSFEEGKIELSHALEIARREGLKEEVVKRAERYLEGDYVKLSRLIDEASKEREKARRLVNELKREREEVQSLKKLLRGEKARVRQEYRAKLKRKLDEFNKMIAREIEKLKSEKKSVSEVEKRASLVRERAEEFLSEDMEVKVQDIHPGDKVRVRSTGEWGRVDDVRGDEVVVIIRGIRWTLKCIDVEKVEEVEP